MVESVTSCFRGGGEGEAVLKQLALPWEGTRWIEAP